MIRDFVRACTKALNSVLKQSSRTHSPPDSRRSMQYISLNLDGHIKAIASRSHRKQQTLFGITLVEIVIL